MRYQIRRYRDYREIFGNMKEDVVVKTFTDKQKCIDWINSLKLVNLQWDGWANEATSQNLLRATFLASADEPKTQKLKGYYDDEMTFHVKISY